MIVEGARGGWLAALIVLAAASAVQAQQSPSAPGSAATAPAVGQVAPDFSLPGATRFGLLKDPVKLSDYRGQTVVVAFFARARTRG
jgi:thioredoxin-dependent peroxiredoxin